MLFRKQPFGAKSKLSAILATALVLLLGFSSITHAMPTDSPKYRMFFGVAGGFGSTDWDMLVTPDDPLNALTLTNPVRASDKGFVFSVFAGFYMTPNFAIQVGFARFPKTRLVFAPFSNYNFPDNSVYNSIMSCTYAYSLLLKVIVPIPNYLRFRPFLDAGATFINRQDFLANKTHLAPQFGIGFIVALTQRFFATLDFQYYTGFGRSDIHPARDYIPFLYQIRFGLAVRFV